MVPNARARTSGTAGGLRMSALAGVSLAVLALGLVAAPSVTLAQTANEQLARKLNPQDKPGEKSKMLVEANQLVYDNDNNKVSATGNAHIYYEGKTLEADKVTYDRNTRRVYAEGNVRMTDEKGTVTHGSRFELTDDFKDGFIDSLRLEQTVTYMGQQVKTRFAAPRGERVEGEVATFQNGTYTACEPCKDHPERPPLWQVKAAKIIHNNSERMIYYENAQLEFLGVPVAWFPYFSAPDPTVKRKSGFLAPRFVSNSSLGYGASLPYFWNLAPNYDLTLTPTLLSRQGVLGQVEWRHRLMNGSYSIRAAGIFQQDSSAFLPSPYGAREKDARGSIESTGKFFINEKWSFGWDVAAMSDKWFLNNYRIKSESLQSIFFRESISTVYLNGQGDRSYFDLRGYYFKPLTYIDWQKQQPIVAPVLDYNRRFDGPGWLGGEIAVDVNFTRLTRDATQYAEIPQQRTSLLTIPNPLAPSQQIGLFEGCTVYAAGRCLVRGMAGTSTRLTTDVTWRRKIIDPLGQVWTPFAGIRADVNSFQPNITNYANTYGQAFLPNYGLGDSNDLYGRAMPMVGLEYRYPFVAATSWGTHIIEPIAQIVARPNEGNAFRTPNNDAQSLTFDDTNLFQWNKFSGYDRVEGGTRANVGAQYTIQSNSGAYANLLFGQSYQLAGENSFKVADISNTGLQSGLDTRRSDYVARVQYTPATNYSFITRARFDEEDFGLRRLEAQATATWGDLSASLTYARYAAQPLLGQYTRREGVAPSVSYRVTPNWSVHGSVVVDLDKYLQQKSQYQDFLASYAANPSYYLANPALIYQYSGKRPVLNSLSAGIAYADECTTFSVTYSSVYGDLSNGTRSSTNQTVMVRLELKTLGQVNFSQQIGTNTDGLNSTTSN